MSPYLRCTRRKMPKHAKLPLKVRHRTNWPKPKELSKKPKELKRTPLAAAVKDGQLSKVKTLISVGWDVNVKLLGGLFETLLATAVYGRQSEIVETLVRAGADVNARDTGCDSILLLATKSFANFNIVKVLVNAGADVDARDEYGLMPLHQAAFNEHVNVMYLLIEAGADVNAKTSAGEAPLHMIAYGGYLNDVAPSGLRLLWLAGSDFTSRNNAGNQPVDITFQRKAGASPELTEEMVKLTVLYGMSKPCCIAHNGGEFDEYWDKCEMEVEVLRRTMFGTSTVSILDFLRERDRSKTVHKMLLKSGYPNNLTAAHLSKGFPTYATLITEKIIFVRRWESSLEKCRIVMQHSDIAELPSEIREMIINHLEDRILLKIVKAAMSCFITI